MNESKRRRFRDRITGAPTLINVGCKISGTITGKADIQVSGEVDGDCDIEGTLSLVQGGYWHGTITAGNVVVSGHVEGDILARGKVEISDTARITGTVTGAAIAVAEGAVVEGQMRTTEQSDPIGFVEKRGRRED